MNEFHRAMAMNWLQMRLAEYEWATAEGLTEASVYFEQKAEIVRLRTQLDEARRIMKRIVIAGEVADVALQIAVEDESRTWLDANREKGEEEVDSS